ncbi:MAG: energy transducer TonB [Sphingomonas bacterium]
MKSAITLAAACLCTAPANARMNNRDNYPPEALKHGWEGTVSIHVKVGADGTVKECQVSQTSGHDVLDNAACRIFLTRVRYRPATNERGEPIDSYTDTKVNWVIPK